MNQMVQHNVNALKEDRV